MSSLALIATFYRRPWAIPRIGDALRAQTRAPDDFIALWEDEGDEEAVEELCDAAVGWVSPHMRWERESEARMLRPDPANNNPLGVGINKALDLIDSDYITYLTDDSLPAPDKYRRMVQALDENPSWGAVYCSQDYGRASGPDDWLAGGTHEGTRHATEPEPNPFTRVDHTQVMHRRCKARWPESFDDRKLSDAHFFRDLVAEVGPLMPVPEVLDWTRQLPDGLSKR